MANEAEQALYQKLAAVPTFHPSTVSLLPDDWALEPGDVVTVQSDGQDYLTPVYSMELEWNGAPRVSIQSTGNKKRAPLSALQRKSFSSGRSGYKTQKDLDEAKVVYDRHFTATDKVVQSTMTAVGVKLNPDGTPMVDPTTGEYVFDDQGATLASKVTATAGELATEVSTRTQQGETFASAISQTSTSISQIVTAVGSNGQVTSASIVTAINNDPTIGTTSSITLNADKINLNGVVTSSQMDTRLMNADALFTQAGYAGTIYANGISGTTGNISDLTVGTLRMTTSGTSSDTITRKGVKIAGALQSNILLLATGTDTTLDIPNAIATIAVDDNPPTGKIGFKYTTLASSTPVAVNFSIADTAYYQSHVGIYQLSLNGPIGQPYQEGENKGTLTADKYYQVVATPNAGNAQKFFFKTPASGTTITALNPAEVTQSDYNSSSYTATTVAHDKYYTVGTTPNTNVGIKFHVPASGAVTIDLNGGNAAAYPIKRSSKSTLLSDLGTTENDAVEIFQRGSSSNNVDTSNWWHGFRIDAGSTSKYYYFQNKTPSGGSHNITCSSNVASIGTDKGQRTSAGSISKSGLIANSYLGFAITCGGSTKEFYITVNP